MKRSFSLLLLHLVCATLLAQQQPHRAPSFTTESRWSLGFRGGVNIWINDLNTRRLSPGGDMTLLYGLSKRFSLGVMFGYDRLIAIQYPNDPPSIPQSPIEFDYMALKTVSANVLLLYHFPPTMEIRPYVYIGAGGARYLRQDLDDKYIPEGKYSVNSTVHFPVGFGFEVPMSQSASFLFDFGGRIMDDYTDHWKGNTTVNETNRPGVVDWYPTARLGFNIYFGNKDGGDDDNDGLTNGEERKYGTNPNNPDSDGDGLRDGDELWRYNTDPLKWDSDNDALSDGDEVLKYKSFPNKPDTDFDGLTDGMEALKYDTDPLQLDTDADGLGDGDEVVMYGTNPLKMDTDGDGLSDGDELSLHRTDPRNKDTDAGSIDDGVEVKRGSKPLDASDDVPRRELKAEVGQPIILDGIVFRTGSAVISPLSQEILTLAANTLQNHPDMTVEIRGHTDNTGSRATNDHLSQRRADAVKLWIVNRGIEENRIRAVGYGQDSPIDSNFSSAGRQRNRRIEFYRTK